MRQNLPVMKMIVRQRVETADGNDSCCCRAGFRDTFFEKSSAACIGPETKMVPSRFGK
jgi:hypothetical protein